MALEGTVHIPGGGTVSKKAAVIGVAFTGGLIAYYYVKKRSAAAAAAPAATTTDQYPPDGTTGNPSDPYSTDPATGQTYGNEAAGSGGAYGAFGSGAASGMYYDPATGAYDLTSPYGTSTSTSSYQVPGGPPFSNNSAWSDWVIQELQTEDPSINVGALVNALGAYLDGRPVTAAQKTLIFDATAIGGDPPVAGPGNYPPNVRTSGNGGGTTETVPGVVGKDADAALEVLKDTHLTGKLSEDRKPGKTYLVTAQAPAAGKRVAEHSTVTLTIREKTGGGGTKPKKKIPDVTGEPADRAVSTIEAAGFETHTSPLRDRRKQYIATGTRPRGEAPEHSVVVITVREKKR